VRQDDHGLSVRLVGLKDQSLCEPLAVSIRQALEKEDAAVGPIRVRIVDALERGSTGKAPLIVARAAGVLASAALQDAGPAGSADEPGAVSLAAHASAHR
jgi:hypothetical protein